MAKTKIAETFELFAVVDQYGSIVFDEFSQAPLVFLDEQTALDNCDDGEQVRTVRGYYHYTVKLED